MSKAVLTFSSLLVALAGIVSVLGQEGAVTVPCQSGSAVKVGIPWPDSKEPLSSLEYTLDEEWPCGLCIFRCASYMPCSDGHLHL